MHSLKSFNLAPRPTFTRKGSDISLAESGAGLMPPPSPALSDISTDAFIHPRSETARRTATYAEEMAARTAQGAKTVLPYWREGAVFAAVVAVISWLGVLTQKIAALENVPFCEEMPKMAAKTFTP